MQEPNMASQAMSRSGYHSSPSDSDQHFTIQRDNSAPKGTADNNVGHIYKDGKAKATNGGSILWALRRDSST